MDKLTRYRQLVKSQMAEYARLYNLKPESDVETLFVADLETDNYLLLSFGWSADNRVRRTILHVRLRGEKIWIEEDWTEQGIATDFVRAGVRHQDIVLAFHPPDMRPLTEFAVA